MAEKEKVKKTNEKQPENGEKTYINRELSWLEFNRRVLLEAADNSVPLLERLKFLAIYQSNLEEFYQVRMGNLTHRALLEPKKADDLTGMVPEEQIREVLRITAEQQGIAESVWKMLRNELKDWGVDVLDFRKISKVDELMSKKLFGDIRSMLFPKVVEPNQPLPFLWGGESYLVAFPGKATDQRLIVFSLDRIPPYLSFEIEGRLKIALTAQLLRHFLPLLLKKETIRESAVIQITRNADVFLSNIESRKSVDQRQKMSSMLNRRKREQPVRVQVFGKISDSSRELLIKKLKIQERCMFTTAVPFDLGFRSAIMNQDGLRYPDRRPAREIGLKKGDFFRYIEKKDLLLSYPFQSMLPFVDLIYEAADDPDVLSIKITLYRMSVSSKIAAALAYAADRGKDVLCLLELRARFDEQNNIDYSEMLEDAGCRVIYGPPDYKVHSKILVITRQKDGDISYITQVGTGNYNEVTGEQYTDLALFTADRRAGLDAEMVFSALINGELPPETQTLWVAPNSFKTRLIEFLDREIAKGPRGRVSIKVNGLNNLEIMEKLIECSQAGVKVELFIRGICCLCPGIPGKTDNITVSGVIDRWLEHSRIYSFGEGAEQRLFIGSGDMLNRNLERRVEAFMEVVTPDTREQVNEVLNALRSDKEKSREMQPDGSYIREKAEKGTASQERLYRYFSTRRVTFEAEPQSETVSEPQTEPQAEVVSEPEAELQFEAVSELEAEPQAETVSEPEAELQAEAVSEPEAELQAEAVSEPEAVPQAETVSEPEAELQFEAVSELEAEPQAETVSEPETELQFKAVSEPESEPQSESVSEPETELQAEAVSESEAEPQFEAVSELEAEPQAETVSEPETEPQAEVVSEPEAESQSEAVSESEAESQSEAVSEPEAEPQSESVSEPETELQAEAVSVPEAEIQTESESQSKPEPQPEAEPVSEPLPVEETPKKRRFWQKIHTMFTSK